MTLPIAQLAKLLPLLGSNQVGEQLATLDMINKIMKNNESDWHDLVKALNGNGQQHSSNESNGHRTPPKEDFSVDVWIQMPFNEQIKWINLLLSVITNPWEQGFLSDTLERLNHYRERTHFSPKQVAVIERMIDAAIKAGYTVRS